MGGIKIPIYQVAATLSTWLFIPKQKGLGWAPAKAKDFVILNSTIKCVHGPISRCDLRSFGFLN
jgi:hypothetical protein